MRLLAILCLFFLPTAFSNTAVAEQQGAPAEASTPASAAESIIAQLSEARARLKEIDAARRNARGDERRVLDRQYQDEELTIGMLAHDLGELVAATEQQGESLGEFRKTALEELEKFPRLIETILAERRSALDSALAARDGVAPENLLQAEQAVRAASAAYKEAFGYYVRHVELLEKLGLEHSDQSARVLALLDDQAGRTAARLRLIADEKAELERHLTSNPDDAAARQRAAVLGERFGSMVANLRQEADLLDRLGGDSSDYRKLLVTSTGDISAIGLDGRLAASLIEDWLATGQAWLADNGLTVILRCVVIALILAGTWLLSRVARRLMGKALLAANANVSHLLSDMLVNVAGKVVIVLGLLVALSQLGISVGPMLAGLGIAGFIVGFALQDTLGNFASGVLILFYRPYDVGDVIEAAGVVGSVSAMSLVSTTILTPDHQTLIVPNKMIWGGVIRNITLQKQRRVDLIFGIAYGDDVAQAERVLSEVVQGHPKVLAEPQPVIRLHELAESSVKFCVRPWVRTEDYWEVYWDLTRTVKLRFDEEGLTIPFPQREVHLRGAVA
jgi:small conductance mechanosensitive channel